MPDVLDYQRPPKPRRPSHWIRALLVLAIATALFTASVLWNIVTTPWIPASF